jgi:hypothetical protein
MCLLKKKSLSEKARKLLKFVSEPIYFGLAIQRITL